MSIHTPRIRRSATIAAAAMVLAACGSSATDVVAEDTTTEDTAAVAEDTNTEAGDAEESTDADTGESSDSADSSDELAVRTAVAESAQWADNVTITIDGDMMIFESDGLPSHEYLDVYLGDGQDGKFIAGGVEAYDARFEIPIVPTIADAPSDTGNGAIGVSISGAVFFDPYEGDGSAVVANDDNSEIDGIPFIDACGGHPLPNAISYHYHGVPFCVTDAVDTPGEHSVLIGYLFDGHGIYGPQDVDGNEPTDLDVDRAVDPAPADDLTYFLDLDEDNARRTIGLIDGEGTRSAIEYASAALDLDQLVVSMTDELSVAVVESDEGGLAIGTIAEAHGNHNVPSAWWTVATEVAADDAEWNTSALAETIVYDTSSTGNGFVYATREGLSFGNPAAGADGKVDVIASRALRFVAS